VVKDAGVGGYANCGTGTDHWKTWGDTNEGFYNPDLSDFNIQNQSDISDYPCFSKYYVTFPLDSVPAGKAIVAATLTLRQFGNSDPANAKPSFIQVLSVGADWDERTITWNNAPLAVENYGGNWVDPLLAAGVTPRTWDVTRAVADAIKARRPLRLALYTADNNYHSGKYFIASGSWKAEDRPTLDITWGD